MQKILNNTSLRNNGVFSKITWDGFFDSEEVEKIVNNCLLTELKESTVSIIAPSTNNNLRTSKVNFHTPNPDNQWIFDRINIGIESINNDFFHFDL